MYCYSNNGLSMRRVDPDYGPKKGEAVFDNMPTLQELEDAFPKYTDMLNKEDIKRQIRELENTITPRRRDEAILGHDNGWLANMRDQITALREQL